MPSTIQLLARNTHILLEHCHHNRTEELTTDTLHLLDLAHAQWERRLHRLQKKKGTAAEKKELRHLQRGSIFRFHWSGDIIHPVHARSIREATKARPDIQCWLYTRSFHLLKELTPLPSNLIVWLSEDPDNQANVKATTEQYPWAYRTALMDESEAIDGELVCPKLQHHDGVLVQDPVRACSRCRICVDGIEKVTRIAFPVHRALGFRGPTEHLQKSILFCIK